MMEGVAIHRRHTPVLLVISAPSGAGKTTVGRQLLDAVPSLQRAVTCTTRPPREGERDGVDYFFLDTATFERRLAAGEFLEHARVYQHFYGTLKSEVCARLENGRDVLLTVDVQGASAIRDMARTDAILGPSAITVFLMPPSMDELRRRLHARNQDAPVVIARRLSVARDEMRQWAEFDFVVVSGSVADDLASMRAILASEKLRANRIRSLAVPGLD